MSTLSAVNNVQQQVSGLNTSNITDKASGGAAFEKALDFAMDNKDVVIPAPASMAIDAASVLIEEKGVLSSAANIAIMKSNIEDVFGGLSTGIASSLMAGLAGEDIATRVIPTTDLTSVEGIKSLAASLTGAPDDVNPLLGGGDMPGAKKMVEGIEAYLPDNKTTPIATAALTSLEDSLLENEDDEDKTTA